MFFYVLLTNSKYRNTIHLLLNHLFKPPNTRSLKGQDMMTVLEVPPRTISLLRKVGNSALSPNAPASEVFRWEEPSEEAGNTQVDVGIDYTTWLEIESLGTRTTRSRRIYEFPLSQGEVVGRGTKSLLPKMFKHSWRGTKWSLKG